MPDKGPYTNHVATEGGRGGSSNVHVCLRRGEEGSSNGYVALFPKILAKKIKFGEFWYFLIINSYFIQVELRFVFVTTF